MNQTGFLESVALREAGVIREIVPGDHYYVTIRGTVKNFLLSENEDDPPKMYNPVRAFTLDELLEMPEARRLRVQVHIQDEGYGLVYHEDGRMMSHENIQSLLNFLAQKIADSRKETP